MNVLGIETSCDETAASIVCDHTTVLSNVICSQIEWHRRFGGVVPEVASRKHLEFIEVACVEALREAGVSLGDVAALAVTHGPGLVGSLLVGVAWAKGISSATGIPILPVNHLKGHIYSNFLGGDPVEFPLLTLIVSGGHSDLVLMRGHGRYETLGRTRDDAAGEAFDKVARALGLGFPGGPAVDRAAQDGNPRAFRFPRADLGKSLDFSFSGLKTSVMRAVRGMDTNPSSLQPVADLAASFQEAVVDALLTTTFRAVDNWGPRTLAIAGGVAANRCLRERMTRAAVERDIPLRIPAPELCTDNAAMIACCGSFKRAHGHVASIDFDTYAYLPIDDDQ